MPANTNGPNGTWAGVVTMWEMATARMAACRRGTATAQRTPSDARLYRTWKSLRARIQRTGPWRHRAPIHVRNDAGLASISTMSPVGGRRCDDASTDDTLLLRFRSPAGEAW